MTSSFLRPDYTDPVVRTALAHFTETAIDAALEPSTRATYASHVRGYTRFCDEWGQLPAFPVSRTSLQYYMAHYIATGQASTTLRSIISAIKSHNERAGHAWLPDPDRASLKRLLTGLFKIKPPVPTRKLPVTLGVFDRIATNTDLSELQHAEWVTMCYVHDLVSSARASSSASESATSTSYPAA